MTSTWSEVEMEEGTLPYEPSIFARRSFYNVSSLLLRGELGDEGYGLYFF